MICLDVRASVVEVRQRPSLFLLMLAACAEAQGEGPARESVATLDDFPAQLDLAIELLDAMQALQHKRVTMDGRTVADLDKLRRMLSCYRDSLVEVDVLTYCKRQAGPVREAGPCPNRDVVPHCPYICAHCLRSAGNQGERSCADPQDMISVDAEAEWCPHLHATPAEETAGSCGRSRPGSEG